MTTKELSEAGVTRIVMPRTDKTPRTDKLVEEAYIQDERGGGWMKSVPADFARNLELANSILRSAMYDIQEHDNDGARFGKCGRIAEKALTESALDEKGRMAAMPNDR